MGKHLLSWMYIYVLISVLQVDSKFLVGLGGIMVVGCSVLASMGFYSWIGIPSSLVILQVVPFLVLAVGADNIFIFVLEYQVSPSEHTMDPQCFRCFMIEIIFNNVALYSYRGTYGSLERQERSRLVVYLDRLLPACSCAVSLSLSASS